MPEATQKDTHENQISSVHEEGNRIEMRLRDYHAPCSLPEDWSVGISKEFKRYYYFNLKQEKVSWVPPPNSWNCSFGLPYGWEIGIDNHFLPYYISHVTETTTYRHPKLDTREEEVLEEALQTKRKHVAIKRDKVDGFGFVAGSEKPVLIRAVTPGSPSEGLVSANDQIFSINGQIAYNLPQPQVISMIRSCTDVLELDVIASEDIQDVKNQGKLKSALMSRATRERRRSCPVNVRFDEKLDIVDIAPYNMLNVNMIKQMVPNVLKVFLENGQTKSFQYKPETTILDIFESLVEKLQLQSKELFCLVLIGPYPNQISYLQSEDKISEVLSRKHFSRWECRLQISFPPRVPFDLLESDPFAFDYLYEQTKNSVINGQFGAELKYDVALRLAALQMNEEISRASTDEDRKLTLKEIQKEHGGLENFIPRGIMYSTRKKELKKSLNYHLKLCERLTAPGQKHINSVQSKLHYLKIASEAATFGGKTFNAVVVTEGLTLQAFREKQVNQSTISVGVVQGISVAVPGASMMTTQLADYMNITGMVITTPMPGKDHLKLFMKEGKPISFVMEPQDAEDMAFLLAGYQRNGSDNPSDRLRILNFSQSLPRLNAGGNDGEVPLYSADHKVLPSSWNYPEENFDELWNFSSLKNGESKLSDITLPMSFCSTIPGTTDTQPVENSGANVLEKRTASDFGLQDGPEDDDRFRRIPDLYVRKNSRDSSLKRSFPMHGKPPAMPNVTDLDTFSDSDDATDAGHNQRQKKYEKRQAPSTDFVSQELNASKFLVNSNDDDDGDEPMFRGTRLFSGGASDFSRTSSFGESAKNKVVLSSFLPENLEAESDIPDEKEEINVTETSTTVETEKKYIDLELETEIGNTETCTEVDIMADDSKQIECLPDSETAKDNGIGHKNAINLHETAWKTFSHSLKANEDDTKGMALTDSQSASDKTKTEALDESSKLCQGDLNPETADPFKGVDPFKNLGQTRHFSIDMKTFNNRGIKTKAWDSLETDEYINPQNIASPEHTDNGESLHRYIKAKVDEAKLSNESSEKSFEMYLSNSDIRKAESMSSLSEDDSNIFTDPTASSLPRGVKGNVLTSLYENELWTDSDEGERANTPVLQKRLMGNNILGKREHGKWKESGLSSDISTEDSEIIIPVHRSPDTDRVQSPDFFIMPPPPLDFLADTVSPTPFIVPPPPEMFDDELDVPEEENRFPNLCAVDDLDLIQKRSIPPPPPIRGQSLKGDANGIGRPKGCAELDVSTKPTEASSNHMETPKSRSKNWTVQVEKSPSNKVSEEFYETSEPTSPRMLSNSISQLTDEPVSNLNPDSNVTVHSEKEHNDQDVLVSTSDVELEEYILVDDATIDLQFQDYDEDKPDNEEVKHKEEKKDSEKYTSEQNVSQGTEKGDADLNMGKDGIDGTIEEKIDAKIDKDEFTLEFEMPLNILGLENKNIEASESSSRISDQNAVKMETLVRPATTVDEEMINDRSEWLDASEPVLNASSVSNGTTQLEANENLKTDEVIDTISDPTQITQMSSNHEVDEPIVRRRFGSRNSNLKYAFLYGLEPVNCPGDEVVQSLTDSSQAQDIEKLSTSLDGKENKQILFQTSTSETEDEEVISETEPRDSYFEEVNNNMPSGLSGQFAKEAVSQNLVNNNINDVAPATCDLLVKESQSTANVDNVVEVPGLTFSKEQPVNTISPTLEVKVDTDVFSVSQPIVNGDKDTDETVSDTVSGNTSDTVCDQASYDEDWETMPRRLSALDISFIDDSEATFFFGPDDGSPSSEKKENESQDDPKEVLSTKASDYSEIFEKLPEVEEPSRQQQHLSVRKDELVLDTSTDSKEVSKIENKRYNNEFFYTESKAPDMNDISKCIDAENSVIKNNGNEIVRDWANSERNWTDGDKEGLEFRVNEFEKHLDSDYDIKNIVSTSINNKHYENNTINPILNELEREDSNGQFKMKKSPFYDGPPDKDVPIYATWQNTSIVAEKTFVQEDAPKSHTEYIPFNHAVTQQNAVDNKNTSQRQNETDSTSIPSVEKTEVGLESAICSSDSYTNLEVSKSSLKSESNNNETGTAIVEPQRSLGKSIQLLSSRSLKDNAPFSDASTLETQIQPVPDAILHHARNENHECQSKPMTKCDMPKTEIPKSELSKPEMPEPDMPKPEMPKPEMPKPEVPKPEVPKPEMPKPEMPTPEISKPEIPKPAMLKPEIPKPEISKPEIPKPEIPKPEIPKPEMRKPEMPKPETPKPVMPKSAMVKPEMPKPEIPKSDMPKGPLRPANASEVKHHNKPAMTAYDRISHPSAENYLLDNDTHEKTEVYKTENRAPKHLTINEQSEAVLSCSTTAADMVYEKDTSSVNNKQADACPAPSYISHSTLGAMPIDSSRALNHTVVLSSDLRHSHNNKKTLSDRYSKISSQDRIPSVFYRENENEKQSTTDSQVAPLQYSKPDKVDDQYYPQSSSEEPHTVKEESDLKLSRGTGRNIDVDSFKPYFFQGKSANINTPNSTLSSTAPINGPIPFRSRALPTRVLFKPKYASIPSVPSSTSSTIKLSVAPPPEDNASFTLKELEPKPTSDSVSLTTTTLNSASKDSHIKSVVHTSNIQCSTGKQGELSQSPNNTAPSPPTSTPVSSPPTNTPVSSPPTSTPVPSLPASSPVPSLPTSTPVPSPPTSTPVSTRDQIPSVEKKMQDISHPHSQSYNLENSEKVSANPIIAKPYGHVSFVPNREQLSPVVKASSLPRDFKAETPANKVVLVSHSISPENPQAVTRDAKSRDSLPGNVYPSNTFTSPPRSSSIPRTPASFINHDLITSPSVNHACETAKRRALSLKIQLMSQIKQARSNQLHSTSNEVSPVKNGALLDSMRAWARSFSKSTRNFVSCTTDTEEAELLDFIQSSLDRLNNLVISTIVFYESAASSDSSKLWHNLLLELVKSVLVVVDEYGSIVGFVQASYGKPITDTNVISLMDQADQLGFAVTVVIRAIRSMSLEIAD